MQLRMGNTIHVHRVFKSPPERVYRAFTEAAALERWLPPNGFTCKVAHLEAKVGGTFRMSFTDFATKHSHSFGGEFLEMKPNEKLRYTDKFDDPNLPGVLTVTVIFKEVSCGTDVYVTQENVPDVIPEEMCYLGWQDSMRHLAALVDSP
jgi:uncharacterized protein YndB with AHSA1/START domain